MNRRTFLSCLGALPFVGTALAKRPDQKTVKWDGDQALPTRPFRWSNGSRQTVVIVHTKTGTPMIAFADNLPSPDWVRAMDGYPLRTPIPYNRYS